MTTQVRNNSDKHRYEITDTDPAGADVLAGFTVYREREDAGGTVVDFVHTETEPGFEGRGLATELIQAALDDVRARDLRVRATCPFVHAFIEKHADYQDLLAE